MNKYYYYKNNKNILNNYLHIQIFTSEWNKGTWTLGPATTPISVKTYSLLVKNISIVVAGPQVVTVTTSCCSRLEEVNGVVILSHLLNIFIAELSSSFFQAAKVGSIKGI